MSGFSINTQFAGEPENRPPVSASGERVIKPIRRRGVAPQPPPSEPTLEPIFKKESAEMPLLELLSPEAQIESLKFQLDLVKKDLAIRVEHTNLLQTAFDDLINKESGLEYKLQAGLLGDVHHHDNSTTMSPDAIEIASLQETITELSKSLGAANTKNETLEANYTSLEEKFVAELEEHEVTRDRLNGESQSHDETNEFLNTVRRELANERKALGECGDRVNELSGTENNLKIELRNAKETIRILEVKLLTRDDAFNTLSSDSKGLIGQLHASENEIANLKSLLQTADENEKSYVAEIKRLQELEAINENVRAGIGSFYDNPGNRFPLDPKAFQPGFASPNKQRAVSSGQQSLFDELEGQESISDDESGSESGSRRDSNASERHMDIDRSRPVTPEIHHQQFIIRFVAFTGDISSTATLKLSNIAVDEVVTVPIDFLDSGIIKFYDHEPTPPASVVLSESAIYSTIDQEPTPLAPVVLSESAIYSTIDHEPISPVSTIAPPPQIPSHVPAGAVQETVPSPITLTFSGIVTEEVVTIPSRPISPELLTIQIGTAQETIPPLPVNLTFSGHVTEEVVPIPSRPASLAPLTIQFGESQETLPPLPVTLTISGHATEEVVPIPSSPVSPELLTIQIGTAQEALPPPPVTLTFSGHTTEEVVPGQSHPGSPAPLTVQFGEVQQTVPSPIISIFSDLVTEEVVPTPINHNLTTAAVLTVANLAPAPAIGLGHVGTQTGENPAPIPEVLTQTGIQLVHDGPPIVIVLPDAPAIGLDHAGTQTVENPTPIPEVLTQTGIQLVHDDPPIVLVLTDAPDAPAPDAPQGQVIYVDRPYEISAHNPLRCWLAVEKNFFLLIYHVVLIRIMSFVARFFTSAQHSSNGTPVVTGQPTQPSAGNAQTGVVTDDTIPATPTMVIQSPIGRLKARWFMTVFSQIIHCLFYAFTYWAFTTAWEREVWFNANENTRSFLSSLLAFRANPDRSNVWNPSFWIGDEWTLRFAQFVLFAAQNVDLYQLKGNYIPG